MEREVHGGMYLRSGHQRDEAAEKRQAESDFLRAYVAKHPDVYSSLEESERLIKDKMNAIFLGLDEIDYSHVPAGELHDERTEALIAQDPDTLRYMADLAVQTDLQAENTATRRKIDKDILKKMACAKGCM